MFVSSVKIPNIGWLAHKDPKIVQEWEVPFISETGEEWGEEYGTKNKIIHWKPV